MGYNSREAWFVAGEAEQTQLWVIEMLLAWVRM